MFWLTYMALQYLFLLKNQVDLKNIENFLYQASFHHIKDGLMLVLALHNLLRQIHMFLDILEFRVENKQKNISEKLFW